MMYIQAEIHIEYIQLSIVSIYELSCSDIDQQSSMFGMYHMYL